MPEVPKLKLLSSPCVGVPGPRAIQSNAEGLCQQLGVPGLSGHSCGASMMAELPYVPYSQYTCDHNPGERPEIGFRLGLLWLHAIKKWETGSLADLPTRSLLRISYVGRLGLSISSERSCHPRLGPFPSTISKGSGKAPNIGLVGYLIVCQPGPACSHLLNKQRRSGGFPYYPPTWEFTSDWETGFLAPLVSKGCLGVVPINYQTLSLWALSGSIIPMSLISASYFSW